MQKFSSRRGIGIAPRRGAMIVLIVICLPIILAFSVLTINVAWMQLTRTELRTATDASARAGSRTLSLTQDVDAARTAAIDGAANNTIAGQPLQLAAGDLQLGNSQPAEAGLWQFAERADNANDINAVRVTGRRDAGSASGAVPLLMTGLFDRTTFEPVKVATATQSDRDVVLVLDRSGSMNSWAGNGSRWDALQDAVGVFLETLEQTPQEEQVGLVTYSTNSQQDVNLTMDYDRIRNAVNNVKPYGWTAIGMGIQDGQRVVMNQSHARTFANKTIVVMTDGQHNRGKSPESASADAHNQDNITVHTITFSNGANKDHMQTVANDGGGSHWHADDEASLLKVFEDVANNLPTLITE